MGAEAAAAHADAVLVAEDRGDQAVVEPVDGERDDAEWSRRGRRSDRGRAGRGRRPEPSRRRRSQFALVGDDAVEPISPRRREWPRRSATAPSTFGLPASSRSGQVGPGDVVEW